MRRFLLVLLLFAAGRAGAAELRLPVPELETLPNGLTVAWFVNDHLPVVDLAVLVKSGYRDDPHGKAGTAELVAACLDRGAAGMSAQEISRAVEMLGASRYANADDDTFTVGMHGLAPDAGLLVDLLAKLVARPDFAEAEVTREHARLLDRWSHVGDYGETLATLAFDRAISAGTEYGRSSFHSVAEFRKVGRADVAEFHRRHFTPKNSVLMVVGRVSRDEFRPRILSAFGAWTGEAPNPARRSYTDKRAVPAKGQVLVVDRPGLTQAQVRLGFRAPSIHAPQRYALTVANALLGEYFNSRLNSVIRDKLGLTYGIGSSFNYSKELSYFSISSSTRNETVGQLVKKAVEILRELRQGPVPDDEIRMAKEYLVGGFPLSVSTVGAVASRWLGGYIFELGPGYLNEFVPKVTAVGRAEVEAAVRKDLALEGLLIVVAGEGKEIAKSLAAAGYTRIKRVSARDLM
jgi:zinc protease